MLCVKQIKKDIQYRPVLDILLQYYFAEYLRRLSIRFSVVADD